MEGMIPELHAPAPPQPQTSTQYFLTPLMISMACMFATFFAIVTYHFLVVNFCAGRLRHHQATADLLARAAWNRDSPVGVEEKVLRRIPILSYTVNLAGSGFRSDGECVVCLGEMEEGAAVRVLPNCRHVFHVACIDRWFLAHSSCPVCRSPVVPPPDHQVEPSPTTTEPATGGGQLRRLSSAGTGLLRHAVSIVFPIEVENKVPRGERLRRSLSMDVVINVSTVGSSSSNNNVVASASSDLESGGRRSNNARNKNNSNMDGSVSSSKLMRIRSFTQLRIHDLEAATVTVV